MTYVIAQPCIDVKDKACAGDCPVDCICEGERMLCIHPGERAGYGACEPVCPVEAIVCEDDVPGQWAQFTAENTEFSGQLGSPGGAAKTARCPTTPTTSPTMSPAGNATMPPRQIPERGRASGGPVPGSPAARAAPPASR